MNKEQPQTHEGGELDPNDEKHSIAARLAFWKGRLVEFLAMKSERPIDPVYWDMHHERQIRDEIAALTLEAVKIQLNP